MNNEPDEILCAWCNRPLAINIGWSMSDIKCKYCNLTNAVLVETDIQKIVEYLNKRPITKEKEVE